MIDFNSLLKNFTKKLVWLPVVATVGLLPACSWLNVYKIDIPQGTPVKQSQLDQVKVGMNANQVLYLLGSPAVRDTLNPLRWDYIYDFTAGTVAKRDGKPSIHNAQQYVKIYFDQNGIVTKIER